MLKIDQYVYKKKKRYNFLYKYRHKMPYNPQQESIRVLWEQYFMP